MKLTKNELIRKLLHLLAILIPLICIKLGRIQSILFWLILLVVALIVEHLRRKTQTPWARLFYTLFGPLLRSHEREKLAGVTYLFTSGLIVFTLLPKDIATLSVLFLTVGDGVATIVGLWIGRHKWPGSQKTFEGTMAFILSSFIVSFLVPSITLWIRGLGALLAGVIEALRLPENDNFWIPIISGAFMWIILKI